MNLRLNPNLAALGAAVTVGAGAFVALSALRGGPATDNAYVQGDVTPVSSKVAGHVVEARVRDHQRVLAGDLLFRIDDADYRARASQARADLDARRAALAALDQQLALQRAEIGRAAAAARGAAAQAERAARDEARAAALAGDGWISRARADLVWAARRQADADLDRAAAEQAAARARLEVIRSERSRLAAAVRSAEAALALADIDLESTRIRAPIDGVAGERQAQVGQYVRPGTALVPLVAERVWVSANFKETQLAGVTVGDRVRITADAVPGVAFRGRVESLSPASGARFALLPPDNATGNFTRIVQRIPVRIVLDSGQPAADRLRPGMSARARFQD